MQVLALSKEVLGPKHPDTLSSMSNLAMTFSKQGRSSEAVELLKQAVISMQEVLPLNYPELKHWEAQLAILRQQTN